MIYPVHLVDFVRESNRIEGISREPTNDVSAHRVLMDVRKLSADVVASFVTAIQPDAILRDREGLNVRVGRHVPEAGGPVIRARLTVLLGDMMNGCDPYAVHIRYETLHPFTDGNGRSGRALWLWQMVRGEWGDVEFPGLPRTFLHEFYYQALQRSRA